MNVKVITECPTTWTLHDGHAVHGCTLNDGHPGIHRCVCGDTMSGLIFELAGPRPARRRRWLAALAVAAGVAGVGLAVVAAGWAR